MKDESHISDIIMQWADKCAELKGLEPTRREYANRVWSRILEVMQERIPPMRLEPLKRKNPSSMKL
jgi:hypothetical protein